jgi:hypothetical protein
LTLVPPKTWPDQESVEFKHVDLLVDIATIIGVVLFSWFVVQNDDPSAFFGSLGISALAYLFAVGLSVYGIARADRPRRRFIFFLVIGATVFLAIVYALTHGMGYPVVGVNSEQTPYHLVCTTITLNNASAPNLTQIATNCNNVPGQPYFDYWAVPLAAVENIFLWVPFLGAVMYAMPQRRVRLDRMALRRRALRVLRGGVVAGTLLLNGIGLQVNYAGGFYSPIKFIGPLNPYQAFYMCNSDILTGCLDTNYLYLFVDYLFWVVVACLGILVANELYSSYLSRTKIARRVEQ